jgi:transcriptional regulator with XRE-family HTH domain
MVKFDLLKLKYLIKAKYGKQSDLAKELNITETSLGNKLNNRTYFTYYEIYKLINLLNIKDEEITDVFFKEKC